MTEIVARPKIKQLTSEVRDGHTKKQQDDKAIQELKTSQAQLMKEKSQAQSQLADKNREMTGLRFVSVEINPQTHSSIVHNSPEIFWRTSWGPLLRKGTIAMHIGQHRGKWFDYLLKQFSSPSWKKRLLCFV